MTYERQDDADGLVVAPDGNHWVGRGAFAGGRVGHKYPVAGYRVPNARGDPLSPPHIPSALRRVAIPDGGRLPSGHKPAAYRKSGSEMEVNPTKGLSKYGAMPLGNLLSELSLTNRPISLRTRNSILPIPERLRDGRIHFRERELTKKRGLQGILSNKPLDPFLPGG